MKSNTIEHTEHYMTAEWAHPILSPYYSFLIQRDVNNDDDDV